METTNPWLPVIFGILIGLCSTGLLLWFCIIKRNRARQATEEETRRAAGTRHEATEGTE